MTTENLLVKTKDNNVIVLSVTYANAAEKMRLIKQCERYCQGVDYKDFNADNLPDFGVKFDKSNTDFLREEISGYHHKRQPEQFVNKLKDNNFPPKVKKPNVQHFDTRLPDSLFSGMIKNIGYHVIPRDEIYQVRYNAATNKYEAVDFKIGRAQVSHGEKEITIIRNHFEFAPEDFAKLQTLIADFKAARSANPNLSLSDYALSISDYKDRSLFNIYAKEQGNVNHLDSTVEHELKHIKNAVFKDGLGLKNDYKLMSVDNMYRICVENERSAYLNQLLFCINKYLKQGNYNDFSMFDGESSNFVNHMKGLKTEKERLEYATNMPVLVKNMLKQFNDSHKAYYDKNQFAGNLNCFVKTEPVSAQRDIDGAIFRKIRSLCYNYMIYNPATGKEESVNLAKYITPDLEVEISEENREKLIKPAQNELQKRIDDYVSARDNREINVNLVAPAKALMRSGMLSDSYINEVDGFNIGRLFEEPGTASPDLPETEAPKIPDDKAFWSDDLQKYWSKVDGYSEIAKNNYEYTFKINEARVSYSDRNHVNVSANADFALYVKLLKEPGSKNNVIEFAPTLTKEQALMLYIACTNYGRKMSGQIPTDLSGIDDLKGIPPEEMNKFNHRRNPTSAGNSSAGCEFEAAAIKLRKNRER